MVPIDFRDGHFPNLKKNFPIFTGNSAKGEKDTRMTRDFQGDLFHMEIWVDDVVCKRIYERIKEE